MIEDDVLPAALCVGSECSVQNELGSAVRLGGGWPRFRYDLPFHGQACQPPRFKKFVSCKVKADHADLVSAHRTKFFWLSMRRQV